MVSGSARQRGRLGTLAPQVRDLVEEFLFRDEAFLVQQFNQRTHLPRVEDGQLFEGAGGVGGSVGSVE